MFSLSVTYYGHVFTSVQVTTVCYFLCFKLAKKDIHTILTLPLSLIIVHDAFILGEQSLKPVIDFDITYCRLINFDIQ